MQPHDGRQVQLCRSCRRTQRQYQDKEQRLFKIIDAINSRWGKNFDNDVAVKAMVQIRDIPMKSDKHKTGAKNNTQKDFEFSYMTILLYRRFCKDAHSLAKSLR